MARNAPWNWNERVVGQDGKATPEFLAWLQQQLMTNQLVNSAVPQGRLINTGLGLTGGGDLTQDRTISLDAVIDDLNDVDTTTNPPTDGQALVWNNPDGLWVPGDVDIQTLLDSITNIRGSVLYRGASGWSALGPGSTGQFLKTNGAGADPTWAAGGGGGGGLKPAPPFTTIFPTNLNSLTGVTPIDGYGVYINTTAGTPEILRAQVMNVSGDFDVKFQVRSFNAGFNFNAFGIILWDSATNTGWDHGVYSNDGIASSRWTSLTTQDTDVTYTTYTGAGNGFVPIWFRVTRISGSVQFYYSANGLIWTASRAVVSGSNFNQIGFAAICRNATNCRGLACSFDDGTSNAFYFDPWSVSA